jgi:hypothetical protein
MWIDDSASEFAARLVRRVRLCEALRQVTRPGVRIIKVLLSVWAVGVLLGLSSIAFAESGPDFEAWREACARLPKNRVLGGRLPPRALLPLPRFASVSAVLDAYFAGATNGPLSQSGAWIGEPPSPGFFDVARSWHGSLRTPFEPFVQKRLVPPGSQVLLQGDLHGDIHSLLAVLGRLQERGLLKGFQITDPRFYMAFLGDYTDRGLYGVEVIYTLLRLQLANPGRVLLIRGNHEDISLVSRYGFLAEGQAKYGADFDAAKVVRFHDFLPAAVYLGTGNDVVQLCHGGVEPGFDPRPLLQSDQTNAFQRIVELKQQAYLASQPPWARSDAAAGAEAAKWFRDFRPQSPISPSVIGFMWNDFTVFSGETAFANNPERASIYGKAAVTHLLQTQSAPTTRVHGVIRAHQHSGVPNPIMRRLMASRGAFRHWQEAAEPTGDRFEASTLETGASRPIPEGSVWTLNVSPDSVYGQGNGFTFATVVILQTAPAFADWRLSVGTVEVPVK